MRREYYAQEMFRQLGDENSLGCYHLIAESCPSEVIYQALALVREAVRSGKIRKSKGALFVDIIKRLARSRGIEVPWRSRVDQEVGASEVPDYHSPEAPSGL